MYKKFTFFAVVVLSLSFVSCEKDNDRCNCVDNATGDLSIVSADEQECGDLTSPSLKCYPAD